MRNAIAIMSTLILLLSGTVLFGAGGRSLVDYPEGYRGWVHVKSMVIEEGHPLHDPFGGIHHIYANGMALKAMKSGEPYPDGAVLIFDLLEAKSADNAVVEGPRKLVGVMQKDYKKFADTGGWGFEGFKGDTRERLVSDPKNACFACHESQIQADYVFSRYRK
jgi:hypothetical protein